VTQAQLEQMGVEVHIAHYSGDNSYPTEYTLQYGVIYVAGPTMDLVVVAFMTKVLKELDSLRKWKNDWIPVINDWSSKQ